MTVGVPSPALIEPRFRSAIDRWEAGHITPGGFLLAVLQNDLKEAIRRADDEALANLPHIVAYLYWEIRSDCWGSPENVLAWGRTAEERTA